MANLNVAVLGAHDYAKYLGKRGTNSDMTFYNTKKGPHTVTLIEPTRYPERLAPLQYSISLAKQAILVVDQINSSFGEIVLMLQCAGLKRGLIVLRNSISPEQIAPFIRGTVVEGYELVKDDPNAIRERLLEEASLVENGCSSPVGIMPIDHSFNVKGIGSVALGCIAQGAIRKHDDLTVLPSGKTAQVRSIQKHDQDFDCAGCGERAGVALKGIELKDLDRGAVITNDESVRSISSLVSKAEVIEYWSSPIKEGMVLHIGYWMQHVPARVEAAKWEGDWHKPTLTLALDKMLVFQPGARGILTYPEGNKLRVVGTIELT